MTMLPTDSWNVKARPDLPAYELNTVDPVNGQVAYEDHHLWRRSFGKDFREAWWVELDDGTIVPNRVRLSNSTHRDVTENRTRIVWIDGVFYYHVIGQPIDDARPLFPQPGPASASGAPRSATESSEPMQTTVTGEEVPHAHVVNETGVEKPCTKCGGSGKIIVKHENAPAEKRERATSSEIYNARAPKGASREELVEKEEQITNVLVKAGVLRGHKSARWWVIEYSYQFVLNNIRAFVDEFQRTES